jgi:hypothetical protein
VSEHAVLAPSAAERWLECPASIRMEKHVPEEAESFYALEGTAAHALGEIKASLHFGKITKRQATARRAEWAREFERFAEDADTMIAMEEHTDAYVQLLQERMDLYPNSQIMLEQKLDTGVPQSWGTSDSVIVSPVHVEIIDFKYGQGVEVEAEGNPQLRLYALGALDTYGELLGETELVRMTVHQPRLHHVLTAEMTPDELRDWRTSILPTAELALGEDAPFGPSDTACRWCPASGRCRAQLEKVFETDFDVDPDTLSPEEMAELLARVSLIRDWLNAFEEAALSLAYSKGKPIPGYKVVMSGGKRSFTDPGEAIDFLVEEKGYELDEVSVRKIRGIGELEKLLGVKEFAALMEPYVKKGDGRPSLASEDDPRPAVAPNTEAIKEFGEDLI